MSVQDPYVRSYIRQSLINWVNKLTDDEIDVIAQRLFREIIRERLEKLGEKL